MGSHNLKMLDSSSIWCNIKETSSKRNCDDGVLWQVSICLDLFLKSFSSGNNTVFWTGYSNSFDSWWGSVACSPSQGSCPDYSTCSRQPAQSHAAVGQWRYYSSQVSLSLVLPFLNLPMHKVNQETSNYGAWEIAESCADSEAAFPASGLSV